MTDPLIGQTLAGRYQFEALLGEGSFANVYRATDLQRRVALAAKVLRSDIAHDPTFSERFRREAAVFERLQHPHIVRYYSIVEIETPVPYTFILMDYVPGSTLDSFLESRPSPIRPYASFTYLTPLAAALHYAHTEGIIHRDLKPANILLHDNGTVYITDFGLARILNQASTLTVGMSVGTPYYMSPEQITGGPITAATDIYALGVILYRMYTGHLPFRGDSTAAQGSSVTERITYEHVHLPPQKPSRFQPDLNPAVDEVILRSLAKDPARRFPSIIALYDALAEATGAPPITLADPAVSPSGERIATPPDIKPPEWSQFMPPIVEPPRADIDTDEIILQSFGEEDQAEDSVPQATIRRPRVAKDPTRETIEHPAPPATEPALEQRLVSHKSRTIPAINVGRARDRREQSAAFPAVPSGQIRHVRPRRRNWLLIAAIVGALIVAATVCAAVIYLITNAIDSSTSSSGESPSLPIGTTFIQGATSQQSVSSQRFAFDSRRAGSLDLYIMNIDGSGLQQITDSPGAERGPAWSPDGTRIAFYGADSEQANYDIFVINVDGTGLQNLTQSPDVDDRYPTWSPDGKRIAFHSSPDGDYDLFVINSDGTGGLQRLTNDAADSLGPDWSPDGTQIAFHTDLWGAPYEIALLDVDSGAIRRVTSDDNINSFPTWSPDGRYLAFHAIEPNTGAANIVIIRTDGSDRRQITFGQARNVFPDWSPDGNYLIFQTGADQESSIARIAVEDGMPEPLTGQQANFLPDWAPSG